MPAYRDNYPGRPRQTPAGRGGRDGYYGGHPGRYEPGRRPPRRDDYYDDRGPRYDERPRRGYRPESDYGYEQEYRPRTSRREAPGEYLADISEDRYAAYNEPEEPVAPAGFVEEDAFAADSFSAADDDFFFDGEDDFLDDFSDIDPFDEDDEWLSSRTDMSTASDDYPDSEPSSPYGARSGWSEENGFDGFEDDEDIIRAARTNPVRRNDDGWYGDDDYADMGGGMRKPVRAPGKRPSGSRKPAIVAVCGILFLAVAVVAAIMIFGRSKGAPIPLDAIVDTMTVSQTDALVRDFIDRSLAQTQCTVFVDNRSANLALSDCEITYVGKDAERKNEYVTGTDPETGELTRTEYSVSGTLRYNRTALRSFLDSLLEEGSVPPVDPFFEIDYEGGVMTVYGGADGWGVDVDRFLSQMCSALAASGGGSITVSCTAGAVAAQKLTAADIYEQAVCAPVDAYTTTDSSGETVYHSEINGVDFSKSELEQAMAAGGSQWQVPVSVTYPDINLKDIRKYTFPDLLATYYTYYKVEEVNRSHNLALAAEKINSIILEPGEQFSFNERVGQRTAANGFKKAGVFAGEGNSEDYGGGICQTSSTLYYTCILANLQIDERKNHLYTVPYMQTAIGRNKVYGNDATVDWGWIDFKFTNSKEYPIRIDFVAKGGILTCEIRGTADGYTADFEFETIRSIPYKIKYLPAGNKNQEGKPGYWVKVYRVVYKDGVQIDRKLESNNTYQPMNKVYYTNELPAGFEYDVEYDQNYTPSTDTTTSGTETTTASTTAPTEATAPSEAVG